MKIISWIYFHIKEMTIEGNLSLKKNEKSITRKSIKK